MRTDHEQVTRVRRVLREIAQVVFGPWPIRPALIGFISFVVFQYASGVAAVARNQVFIGAWSGLPINVARAVAIGVLFAILLRVYRKITGRTELTRTGYLVILVFVGVSAGLTRYATLLNSGERDTGQLVFGILRGVVTLMILTSALGVADSRLRHQMRETDAALTLVRTQRSAVLEAEENARQSIASILHDRVQAGLVAATLQLKQLANLLKGEEAARLESVIADLEGIRTQDVRFASRQLSPDLRNVTLSQALKVLASTYEPAIHITVDVDELQRLALLRDPEDLIRLGAYRIVEQALLNAAVHGGATRVTVSAERAGDELVMTIDDDGRGLGPGPVEPGSGFAVMDAWTSNLGGTWGVSGSKTGACVAVRLPWGGGSWMR